MDTKTFLRKILPTAGIKYVAEWIPKANHPRGGVMAHTPAADIDDMIEALSQIDARGRNAYFATASYKEVKYKTIQTKTGEDFTFVVGREKENAYKVKSLWMDWDVGKNNPNSYETLNDAIAALTHYLKETGLPTPLVVMSGYGLHSYWLFSEEVDVDNWERVACLQRVIMRHLGVKFDPSRDVDCSSLLRPVGCHNYKAGKKPRPVKKLFDGDLPLPAAEYKRRLQGFIDDHDLSAAVLLPRYMSQGAGNLADLGTPEYADSFAEEAVKHCAQLQHFAETGGESETIWWASLGLVKFCVDGVKWCHEWSSKYDGYEFAHTQMKIDQWKTGPTTCAKFREVRPSGCAGCQAPCSTRPNGSPISLGLREDSVQLPDLNDLPPPPAFMDDAAAPADTPTTPAVTESSTPAAPAESTTPHCWPEGFGYDPGSDRMYRLVRNPDTGVMEQMYFASPLFYPVEHIFLEEGTHVFRMHAHIRGRIKQFDMPTAHVQHPQGLRTALASNLVNVIDEKNLKVFMNSYMQNLRNQREVINTYNQFGWKHDYTGFLIGNKLITESDIKQVEISSKSITSPVLLKCQATAGTMGDWVEGIDILYNRPGYEPYQMAVGVAFGAILTPMVEDSLWCGIPLALTSSNSGFGKSTAAYHALNIYTNASQLALTRYTPLALSIRLSNMGHLPTVFDEFTNSLVTPNQMADGLYSMSHGQMKTGGNSEGRERTPLPPWRVTPFMTGNKNVCGLLEAHPDLEPEATKLRVFEIDVEYYGLKVEEDVEMKAVADKLMNCYGLVGIEWIRFVMKNREEITERLRTTFNKFYGRLGAGAAKERYFCHMMTQTAVGLHYAKRLGFVRFDLKNLDDWMVNHVEMLRHQRFESSDSPEDRFAHMMSDLASKVLVTKRYATIDGRSSKNHEIPLVAFRGSSVEGRLVVGEEGKERPKLLMSRRAVAAWCAENGVQFNNIKRDWKACKLLVASTDADGRTGTVRASLGRGVVGFTHIGNTPCMEFDPEAGAKAVSIGSEKIVPLRTGS